MLLQLIIVQAHANYITNVFVISNQNSDTYVAKATTFEE